MPRACAQLVSEGGAQGSQRMADPDTRLTDDLNKATDGFCNTFCNVLYTATAGVFHSVELWKHNWVLGLAPYVYLAVSFAFVDYITPVRKTWRPLGRERGRTWGIYCHGQMKLIEKAESVAALNGSEREARLFCEQSTAVRVACYKQHCKFWQFGMINHFFNTYLAGELFPICIISHGILNPKHSSLDTIEDVSAATPFASSFETSKEAAAQMMEVRSDVGVLWVLFSRAFQSARTVIDSLRTLQQLVGDVERVTELIELLDKVTEDKKTEASHTIKDGDMIAFEDVDIVTPAGVGLVNDLSFQLKRGESLLLVGHNGAGKSSIFRCLGGLWSVKGGGTITKPQGGDGLHQEIFYIPQKSYNVLGTLQDQMIYPASGAGDLSEEKLRPLLKAVDLEYLLEREGCLTDEINWEDELSLGEKQRLAIARLLYSKPKYAILDECSSAISDSMTRKLYSIVMEQGITYITIAHRPGESSNGRPQPLATRSSDADRCCQQRSRPSTTEFLPLATANKASPSRRSRRKSAVPPRKWWTPRRRQPAVPTRTRSSARCCRSGRSRTRGARTIASATKRTTTCRRAPSSCASGAS